MKDWLFGGILGLLLGWTLQRCGLPRPCDVQRLLSLRQPRGRRERLSPRWVSPSCWRQAWAGWRCWMWIIFAFCLCMAEPSSGRC